MCPLNPDIFSRIFFCNPTPVAIAISITIIPNAMAITPIFIIGAEILLLYFLEAIKRFAINNS